MTNNPKVPDRDGMIIEQARVLSLPVNGLLWVERVSRSCAACTMRDTGVCACAWTSSRRSRRAQARLSPDITPTKIALNQFVEIGVSSAVFLVAALQFYFMPIVLLLLGALGLHALGGSDTMVALGAVFGFGAGIVLARLFSVDGEHPEHCPVVLRVLDPESGHKSGQQHDNKSAPQTEGSDTH